MTRIRSLSRIQWGRPPGLVWFGHRHRGHPEDTPGGCSKRGEDSYPAIREDIELATREDFLMAMDMGGTRLSVRDRGAQVCWILPDRSPASDRNQAKQPRWSDISTNSGRLHVPKRRCRPGIDETPCRAYGLNRRQMGRGGRRPVLRGDQAVPGHDPLSIRETNRSQLSCLAERLAPSAGPWVLPRGTVAAHPAPRLTGLRLERLHQLGRDSPPGPFQVRRPVSGANLLAFLRTGRLVPARILRPGHFGRSSALRRCLIEKTQVRAIVDKDVV